MIMLDQTRPISLASYELERLAAPDRCLVCECRIPAGCHAAYTENHEPICCSSCLSQVEYEVKQPLEALEQEADDLEGEAEDLRSEAYDLEDRARAIREKAETLRRRSSLRQAVLIIRSRCSVVEPLI